MGKGIVKLGEGQWAVKDGNLLAAKETNGRFKNTEFTVSRGTRASYVGRDGLIKESNLQDVNLVNNGDFSELGSELVVNGTFDTDSDWTKGTGWSISGGKASSDGSQTGNSGLQQSGIAEVGNIYKITFDLVVSSGFINYVNLGGWIDGTNLTTSGTYTYYTDTTTATDNLGIAANADFVGSIDNVSVKEVDPNDYWTVTDSDANNYVEFTEGFARLKFLNTSPITTLSSTLTLEANKTYKLIVDVHDVTSGSIKIDAAGISELFNAEGVTTRYIKPTGNTTLSFYRATSNVDVTLASVSAKEVKTDTPRIDFTDNTDGHLLLEPQSTNLVTHSEDFTDSSWTKLGAGTGSTAIVTPNYAISPDGTQNASRLQCDLNGGGSSSSNQSLIYDLYSSSGNQTLSIYVKSNTGSNQTIYLANTQTSGDTITVTNEWQRFEFNYSSSLYVFAVGLRGRSGGAIDDTADVLIWGAQAEALTYPTSYIPTNGSTVTRDADTCNSSGSSADFNSEEGVLYAEIAALTDDLSNRFISLTDGTDSNSVTIYYGGVSNRIRYEVKSSSAVQANVVTTSYDITNYNKIAVKYKANDFALWVNGTNVAQDVNGLTPVGLNDLSFDRASILDFYGKVKAVRVYKEALSDTDLQNLTS